jgi:hypothetical protein
MSMGKQHRALLLLKAAIQERVTWETKTNIY